MGLHDKVYEDDISIYLYISITIYLYISKYLYLSIDLVLTMPGCVCQKVRAHGSFFSYKGVQ